MELRLTLQQDLKAVLSGTPGDEILPKAPEQSRQAPAHHRILATSEQGGEGA